MWEIRGVHHLVKTKKKVDAHHATALPSSLGSSISATTHATYFLQPKLAWSEQHWQGNEVKGSPQSWHSYNGFNMGLVSKTSVEALSGYRIIELSTVKYRVFNLRSSQYRHPIWTIFQSLMHQSQHTRAENWLQQVDAKLNNWSLLIGELWRCSAIASWSEWKSDVIWSTRKCTNISKTSWNPTKFLSPSWSWSQDQVKSILWLMHECWAN